MGVAWTASAVADFDSLAPDDAEIDLVQQTLHTYSTGPNFGHQDMSVSFKELDGNSLILRVGRFAFIYKLVAGELLVLAVHESLDVPLSVLICDEDEGTRFALAAAIQREPDIEEVLSVSTLAGALHHLRAVNTIFIDPLSTGLETATAFIFEIRQSYPEINVVLYLDAAIAERNRKEFFRDERNVFFQYRTLDKKTPSSIFQEEVGAVLKTCRRQLTWRMSEASVKKALQMAEEQQATEKPSEQRVPSGLIKTAYAGVEELSQRAGIVAEPQRTKSVFLSYRLADQTMVDGFVELLEQNGFTVYTGASLSTYVHQGILERIRKCEFFLCLMTRDEEKKDGTYTASAWVLEEKGAALALGKRPVLMVQKGVSQPGGLHGDWQLIEFTLEDFLKAALKAVGQLKAYSGDPRDPEQ